MPLTAGGPLREQDAAAPGSDRARRAIFPFRGKRGAGVAAAILPPLVALVGMLVLTGLNLNGSSVNLLSARNAPDSSLVAGTPRTIRSDEWSLSTPNIVGNDRRGLPVQPWVGMTPMFLPGSAVGIPSMHWSTTFKPQDWPFLLLGPDRAFAMHWWMYLVGGFIGVYALLLLLTTSPTLSSGIAALVTFAPTTAWWSNNPALITGYLAGALACVLTASRRQHLWASALWGAAAGYAMVASVLLLYPPWQVSLAWVCLAVGVGWLIDHRPRPARVVAAVAAALAVSLPALALWYVQSRDAILAMANTYYPGHRLASGGGGSLAWLLDAPSSLWLSAPRPPVLQPADHTFTGAPLPFANTSEVSSGWFPLPLLAVAVVTLSWVLIRTRRHRRHGATRTDATGAVAEGTVAGPADGERQHPRVVWTGILTGLVTALLLAWMLLPVPEFVGSVTMLGRVTGRRMPVALGLAAGVLLAVSATALRGHRPPRWLAGLTLLGAVGTVAITVWAVAALPWLPSRGEPSMWKVGVIALVLAAGAGLLVLGRLPAVAAAGLGLLSIVTYAPVNPLYRGLGPLTRDPIVTTLMPLVKATPGLRAVVYGHAPDVTPLVVASGAQTLSGLTVYPDFAVWNRIAPAQEHNWNQYSKYDWVVDLKAEQPRIQRISGTRQYLLVNPCAIQVRGLAIDLSLSPTPIAAPCLRLTTLIPRRTGTLYVYRYH